MDIRIHQTFLPHNDAEAAIDFYRDKLGLKIRNDVGYNGFRWLTIGIPGQPETEIVLTPPAADPGITEAEQGMIAEMMAKGTFGHVILSSDDVDAAFNEIQATGAEVVHEPTDQPYGIRDCGFRDPSGNLVRISQRS